jgi:hypothetical protein
MPGPKCITYCKIKSTKFNASKDKLQRLVIFSGSNYSSISFDRIPNKELIEMWKNTEPYGCSDVLKYEQWFIKARNALKETIAERQLLGIK